VALHDPGLRSHDGTIPRAAVVSEAVRDSRTAGVGPVDQLNDLLGSLLNRISQRIGASPRLKKLICDLQERQQQHLRRRTTRTSLQVTHDMIHIFREHLEVRFVSIRPDVQTLTGDQE
jgi:hypothetical protein